MVICINKTQQSIYISWFVRPADRCTVGRMIGRATGRMLSLVSMNQLILGATQLRGHRDRIELWCVAWISSHKLKIC
jgi:hypothetical protein